MYLRYVKEITKLNKDKTIMTLINKNGWDILEYFIKF